MTRSDEARTEQPFWNLAAELTTEDGSVVEGTVTSGRPSRSAWRPARVQAVRHARPHLDLGGGTAGDVERLEDGERARRMSRVIVDRAEGPRARP